MLLSKALQTATGWQAGPASEASVEAKIENEINATVVGPTPGWQLGTGAMLLAILGQCSMNFKVQGAKP